MGHAFMHFVLDDYSRMACAEICEDETGPTAAVLHRATPPPGSPPAG